MSKAALLISIWRLRRNALHRKSVFKQKMHIKRVLFLRFNKEWQSIYDYCKPRVIDMFKTWSKLDKTF